MPFLRAGQLIRALEGCSASAESQFLFYHGHRQVPTALRAFIDMVRATKSRTDVQSKISFEPMTSRRAAPPRVQARTWRCYFPPVALS
jgi:hypothetical protein